MHAKERRYGPGLLNLAEAEGRGSAKGELFISVSGK